MTGNKLNSMVSLFLSITVQCNSVIATLALAFVNVLALFHILQQYLLVMH